MTAGACYRGATFHKVLPVRIVVVLTALGYSCSFDTPRMSQERSTSLVPSTGREKSLMLATEGGTQNQCVEGGIELGGKSVPHLQQREEPGERLGHACAGVVSLSPEGTGFTISLAPASHLDSSRVVVGRIVGGHLAVRTYSSPRPSLDVRLAKNILTRLWPAARALRR